MGSRALQQQWARKADTTGLPHSQRFRMKGRCVRDDEYLTLQASGYGMDARVHLQPCSTGGIAGVDKGVRHEADEDGHYPNLA